MSWAFFVVFGIGIFVGAYTVSSEWRLKVNTSVRNTGWFLKDVVQRNKRVHELENELKYYKRVHENQKHNIHIG